MKNTFEEALEVMKAIDEGKAVEFYSHFAEGWVVFSLSTDCGFIPDFQRAKYRVKPQKKELWCVYSESKSTTIMHSISANHADAVDSLKAVKGLYKDAHIVHMVEKGE